MRMGRNSMRSVRTRKRFVQQKKRACNEGYSSIRTVCRNAWHRLCDFYFFLVVEGPAVFLSLNAWSSDFSPANLSAARRGTFAVTHLSIPQAPTTPRRLLLPSGFPQGWATDLLRHFQEHAQANERRCGRGHLCRRGEGLFSRSWSCVCKHIRCER